MADIMYIRFLQRLYQQRVLMHLLFWAAITFFCFLVFQQGRSPLGTLAVNLEFLPGHIFFVYSLNYFLFPRYVLKGRVLGAVIGFLVILALAILYTRIADVYFAHFSGIHQVLLLRTFPRSVYALFSIGWVAVTIRLVKYWYLEKENQYRLEKEKLTIELRLLKAQLHPHFLFNTLNNLYALTLANSRDASGAVLQLSSLLRYILYECDTPLAPLDREIAILRHYVQLEKMRFRDRLDVSLSFTGDIEDRFIAPLLLLPFVENSIKHGITEQPDKSWISLSLHVEGDTLYFKLVNSCDPPGAPPPPASGMGLANVRRRLQLLYSDRHHLRLTPEEDTYTVSLMIRLTPAQTLTDKSKSIPSDHETKMSFG
jgi:sensor histidine kinase YesM